MELNLCPAEPKGPAVPGALQQGQLAQREGGFPRMDPSPFSCLGRQEMQVGTRGKGMASWGQWNSRNPGWCQSEKTNVAPLKLLANLSIIPFPFLCPSPQFLWVGHCLSLHRKTFGVCTVPCHHHAQHLRTAIFKHWSEIKISELTTTAILA